MYIYIYAQKKQVCIVTCRLVLLVFLDLSHHRGDDLANFCRFLHLVHVCVFTVSSSLTATKAHPEDSESHEHGEANMFLDVFKIFVGICVDWVCLTVTAAPVVATRLLVTGALQSSGPADLRRNSAANTRCTPLSLGFIGQKTTPLGVLSQLRNHEAPYVDKIGRWWLRRAH